MITITRAAVSVKPINFALPFRTVSGGSDDLLVLLNFPGGRRLNQAPVLRQTVLIFQRPTGQVRFSGNPIHENHPLFP